MKVFVGIGSNLDNPIRQVAQALIELDFLSQTKMVKHSSLYRNPAVGFLDQPDFINAVAQLETTLSPEDLLEALLHLEEKHHRIRNQPNGPRTLDLDILFYENKSIQTEKLIIPHPRLQERSFVLKPLFEIAPDLRLLGGEMLSELILCSSLTSLELIVQEDL